MKQKLKERTKNRPIFYFKITREEKWANDIIQGKLFMNTVDFYKRLELESGLKGQGDKDELKIKLNPYDALISIKSKEDDVELERIPVGIKNLDLEFDNDKKKPIFCIMGITLDDMEVVSENEMSIRLKLNFSKCDIDRLKSEFGEYVIIISASEFHEKLNKSLSEFNGNWTLGKVTYTSQNMNERLKLTKNNDLLRFLYKHPDFEYQKEYRLILDEDVEENKVLRIGLFSEGEYILLNIEALLNFELVVNNFE